MTKEEREEHKEILDSMKAAEQEEVEAEQELADFLCSEIVNFEEATLRTKDALITSVATTRQKYKDEANSGKEIHSPSFYAVLDGLLAEFDRKLASATLPDPLNEWWSYSYVITSYGVKLMMNYYEWTHSLGGSYTCKRGEEITIFEVPARMLTVSEYASMNGVETVTVRQWIRRAKIRSAVKYGREWLIPELTETPKGKGYKACRYYWKSTLTELPEKFGFLSEFKNVLIEQSEDRKDCFLLSFNDFIPNVYHSVFDPEFNEERAMETLNGVKDAQVTENGKLIISGKIRAELELYLIANPVVHQMSAGYDTPTELIEEFGGEYCGSILTLWID